MAGIIFHSQNLKTKIVFLDVGQGDSILIEQGEYQILVDGGPDGQKVMEKLGKYIPFWDRKIEMIIATHPDQDHIAGLTEIMNHYQVGQVIDNGAESDSAIFQKYLDVIRQKNINRLRGSVGMDIKLANADLEILYPGKNLANDKNDTNPDSIVSKFASGQNSFLLTGDFPTERDENLFSLQEDLSAKVLKVAHHGSKYATSEMFLEKVKPEEAIISVGKNNRYGHPAAEVLDRLKAKNIKILRTDEKGDIVYDLQ